MLKNVASLPRPSRNPEITQDYQISQARIPVAGAECQYKQRAKRNAALATNADQERERQHERTRQFDLIRSSGIAPKKPPRLPQRQTPSLRQGRRPSSINVGCQCQEGKVEYGRVNLNRSEENTNSLAHNMRPKY
jgi:hypothetical protein